MSIVYSAPPPDGHTPDFNRPHQATALFVCTCLFSALAVVSMAIRIYTRVQIVCQVALDDYIMVLALLLSMALSGFVLDMFNFGMGKHLYDVPLDRLYPHFLFYNLLAAIFFCAATGFAKTSILLFYSRIFPSRRFKMFVWALVAFTLAYSASAVLVNIFSCTPVAKSWEIKYVTTGRCINRPVFYFAQAGLGIFTDFATLLAPLPSMRKLQLPTRQKFGIALILMTGGLSFVKLMINSVCVVSIIRLQSIYVLLKATDLTMATPPALMWCVVELNMSIVGGCVPTLKPFLRKFAPGLLGHSKYGYGTNEVSANRNRSGSHQLKSFDPAHRHDTKKSNIQNTTNIEASGMGKRYGDNKSEEYIIQNTTAASHEDIQKSSSTRPDNGFGRITRTVKYGYEEHKQKI